jgi:hypothetical protein
MNMNYNLQEKGGVYVVQNSAMVDPRAKKALTKIGRSGKEYPMERIESMNKETPVPLKFTVDLISKTPANKVVEKIAHKYFGDEHFNKEFNKAPAQHVSATVKAISADVEKHSYVTDDTYCPITCIVHATSGLANVKP